MQSSNQRSKNTMKKQTFGSMIATLRKEQGMTQFELAEKIIEEQYSVRQTEELVKKLLEQKTEEKKSKNIEDDEYKKQLYMDISKQLNQILGTKVNIKDNKNKGKIEIEYYSKEELDRLFCLFKKL